QGVASPAKFDATGVIHMNRWLCLGAVLALGAGCAQMSQSPQERTGRMTTTATQTADNQSQPPVAPQKPDTYIRHGYTIEDPYAWLKDPGYPEVTDPEVLGYLEAENDYFEAQMGPHKPLIETVYEELKARLKEDDYSVPAKDGAWEYWWQYQPGAQ